MKKALFLPSLLLLLAAGKFDAQLSFSLSNGTTVCYSNYASACINNTVSGATSYSWSVTTPTFCSPSYTVSGNCVNFYMPCNNNYSVTLSAYSGSSLIATTSQVVVKQSPPSVTVTPATATICAGDTVTLTASGASGSFTWYPVSTGSPIITSGPSVTFAPSFSEGYTVAATGNGCVGSSYAFVTVQQPATFSVTAPNSVCAGNTLALSASGAGSYTWLPMNVNTPIATVQNLTAGVHCFTALGASACGQYSSTACVTVQPQPTLSIAGNGSAACPGQAFTLTASGANSYSWNTASGSYTTSTIVQTPTSSTSGVLWGNSGGCSVSLPYTLTVVSLPVSQSHTTVCLGQSATLTASGATGYTWTQGTGFFSNAASVVVTPTVTSTYTVDAVVAGCALHKVITVNVFNLSMNLSGPAVSCPGMPVTLTATGASGYSWTPPASATGSVAVVYPTSNTCYTVLGWTGNCVGTAVHCVSMSPVPNVMSIPSQTVCAGDSAVLVTGAGNHTITFGTTTSPYLTGTVTGANLQLTPTVTTGYTISVQGSLCTTSHAATVTVNQLPNPIISGNNMICAGQTTTLLASGMATYSWSTGSTGPWLVVSPSVTTCYSLSGVNGSGCKGSAVKCVTVNSTALSYTATADTICRGSSVTFTAGGAVSYSWSNGSNLSTLNVSPHVSTTYTVSGTGGNGCAGTAVIPVVVDTTCSDVWPGDANSDGIVGTADVLELGLAANNTGPARNGASNNYAAQECDNWAGTVSTGKNECHADCNGDGTVDADDTLAIHLHFGLSHTFRASGNGSQKIRIDAPVAFVPAGTWSSVDIHLGDPNDNYTDVYGVTFDVTFETQKIDAAYLDFNPSFINANNTNIHFRKLEMSSGIVYAATVRTDHNNVSGAGKIATLHFKTKSGLANNTTLHFGLSGSQLTDNAGSLQSLSTAGEIVTIDNTVGLEKYRAPGLPVYPNPASSHLVIRAQQNQPGIYRLFDLSGRLVISGNINGLTSVDTETIASGTYVLETGHDGAVYHTRVVIQH